MERNDAMPLEQESSPPDSLRAQIAARVRAESQNLGSLTAGHSLSDLFAGLTPEEAEPVLVNLLRDEQYPDIKALDTSGDLYFYSDLYLEPPAAEEMVLSEEVKFRIAVTVRQDSRDSTKLTPVSALAGVMADLELEDVAPALAQLQQDERYQDVRSLSLSDGTVYLFSSQFITDSYATLLSRTAGGDPRRTIAETVRDNARIYPRATEMNLFIHRPFNMSRDEIAAHIEEMQAAEEYKDIQSVKASNGAIYLFSDLHMSLALAKSQAQWEEVEKHDNP
ncbi:hypothetical protein ACFLT5_03700 [Chloroflexota bacterium]